MELDDAAKCLCELGNPHRLKIFRRLVRAGSHGLPVGQLQEHLGIPKSTLSHHISKLVWAGLVEQTREGRVLRCRADFGRMDALVGFLADECCADDSGCGSAVPALEEGD